MVIGASIIIYAIAIGYISTKARNTALNQAISLTDNIAEKYASDIKFLLEEDLVSVRTLSYTLLTYKTMPEKQWKELFAKMYKNIISENPQILSIWDSWELSNLDPTYKKDYGRYVCEFWRAGGKIQQNISLRGTNGETADYNRIKRDKVECIENPYIYSYSGDDKDKQLMTSVIVPLLENEKYIGVIGYDIALNRYHPIINQIKPFEGSYAFLISNDLQYVAHPSIEKIGTSSTADYETLFSKNSVVDKILNGEETSFIDKDINGVNSYFTLKPIIIGKTVRPWSLVIVVPKSIILADANRSFIISIIVGILGLLLLSSIIYLSSKKFIITPLQRITETLKRLALGYIGKEMVLNIKQDDEIGQMATALNTSIDGLAQKNDFAYKIGQGDLNADINLLSEEDLLGKSLLHMRESLKASKEEENNRKIEDEMRQWINAGLAKFSDILRQNNDKLDILAAEIIKNLVHYLNANQGGLFIYNDDDTENVFFELLSAYAFNRHKFIKKQILVGEGLVGTCAMEKQTVYLTEIPENYIQITSGLGEARPRCLLIVPLLIEEKVLGIIELASFNEIQQYQIDFVEKVAQSIASTLISVRTNIRTTGLLAKTQQQAEEMASQEEEMRQNMEELQATQEEAARKTNEMQSYIDALNNSTYVTEYDTNGYIIAINNAYLDLLGMTREETIGTHHSFKLELSSEKQREYDKFWSDLRNGLIRREVNTITVSNKKVVLQETYSPIKNETGQVTKVLKIATNLNDTNSN